MILPKPLTWSGTERIGLFHFLADNSCDDTKTMHIGDFGAIAVTERRLRLADLESGSSHIRQVFTSLRCKASDQLLGP